MSSSGMVFRPAPEPLPVGETGGSKGKDGDPRGGSPALHGAQRRKSGETRAPAERILPRAWGGAPSRPGGARYQESEGSKPDGRDATAARFTRARPRSGAPCYDGLCPIGATTTSRGSG